MGKKTEGRNGVAQVRRRKSKNVGKTADGFVEPTEINGNSTYRQKKLRDSESLGVEVQGGVPRLAGNWT